MNNPPTQNYQVLFLPGGEVVDYNIARPNIRLLTRDIRARGYDVWEHHIDVTGFQRPNPPRGVLLHTLIIGRVILLIADRVEDSSSSGASDISSEWSYYYDSEQVDSDTGLQGRFAERSEDSDN